MLTKPDSNLEIDRELAEGLSVGIIRSQFNRQFTEVLERKCRETLASYGVKNIEVCLVPGALEIPIAAQKLAKTGRFQVLIALGVIIKGDTYHFELVANESARGCMEVGMQNDIPVIMEILAAYSLEQAALRCGDNDQNKGIEAAQAALQIAQTLAKIK